MTVSQQYKCQKRGHILFFERREARYCSRDEVELVGKTWAHEIGDKINIQQGKTNKT